MVSTLVAIVLFWGIYPAPITALVSGVQASLTTRWRAERQWWLPDLFGIAIGSGAIVMHNPKMIGGKSAPHFLWVAARNTKLYSC
jgi:hypothetical protein